MRETIKKSKSLLFASLGAITIALLVSASLAVPTLAYAIDNGNGNSQDGKNGHQKGLKGDPKEPKRCENFVPAKYNKHCNEDNKTNFTKILDFSFVTNLFTGISKLI
jgi:hypothetical protein